MADRFKFRAWNSELEAYAYFNLGGRPKWPSFTKNNLTKCYSGLDCADIIEQCTGETSMNDERLFEGDIVSLDSWSPKEMQIRFIEGAFCLCFLTGKNKGEYCGDIHYIQHAWRKQAKLIGNIPIEIMECTGL